MCSITTKKETGETCIICEEMKHDGYHLYTQFICTDCEKDIIQTETADPKYQFYIKKLKKVILPEIYS